MHTRIIAARCARPLLKNIRVLTHWCGLHKKNCLLLFAGFLVFEASAQNFHYRFTIEGITDPSGAKTVTDELRRLFNHPESPFKVFPLFEDTADEFVFQSDVKVSREALQQALLQKGFVVLQFEIREPEKDVELQQEAQ